MAIRLELTADDSGLLTYVVDVDFTVNPGCPRTRVEPGESSFVEDIRVSLVKIVASVPDDDAAFVVVVVDAKEQRRLGSKFETDNWLDRIEHELIEAIEQSKEGGAS